MTTDDDLGLNRYEPPTLVEVHDAFIAETRGEGGEFNQAGELWIGTVPGVQVVVYLDTWTYYGPIWNARLEIQEQDFSVPLLEGPHIDRDQKPEDALVEAVAWLRKITDAEADRD